MLLALGVVGGIGYVVVDQFAELSTELTRYTSSMRRKVAELRPGKDATFQQLTRTVDRVTEQIDNNAAELRSAQPVRVVAPRPPVERLREVADTVFEPIASTIIVIALVAFMLASVRICATASSACSVRRAWDSRRGSWTRRPIASASSCCGRR